MLLIESTLHFNLEDVHILESGIFYFFKDFIVSEINEGVNFNWRPAQEVIKLAANHYTVYTMVASISKRLYSYSLASQDWLTFFEGRYSLSAFAVVSYNKMQRSDINRAYFL